MYVFANIHHRLTRLITSSIFALMMIFASSLMISEVCFSSFSSSPLLVSAGDPGLSVSVESWHVKTLRLARSVFVIISHSATFL